MAQDIFDLNDPSLISFNTSSADTLPPSSPAHDNFDDFAPSSPTPAGPRLSLPEPVPEPPVIHFLGLPHTPHPFDRASSVPLALISPSSPQPHRAISLPAPSSPPSTPVPLSRLQRGTTPPTSPQDPLTPFQTPQHNRHRANSLPIAPSSGATSFVPTSSPWTKITRAAKSKAAGQKKRRETLKRRRMDDSDSSGSGSDSDELEELTPARKAKLDKFLQRVVKELDEEELNVGELVQYMFNPVSGLRERLWKSFFRARARATSILNWWMSPSTSKTGRAEVHNWAVEYVAGVVAKEAEVITQSGYLRSKDISEEVATFSFSKLYEDFKTKHAVVTTRIFEAVAHSARQIRDGISSTRLLKKQTLIATSIASCLSEHSQKNNVVKRIFGMFLYATGAQRQVLTTLSHVGYAESYTNLTAKAGVGGRKTSGPLEEFSEGQRTGARSEALNPEIGEVYDNLNSTKKVVEQVMGRTATVESGTASTIFPLHKADRKDMKLDEFETAFDTAPPLSQRDILLTADERIFLRKQLIHCVLRIIVNHGPGFADRFQSSLTKTQPSTPQKIVPHQTPLFPLPTWKIDESTIVGNAEVDEAVVEELRLCNEPMNWMKYVRIIAGDQLSIARLRALAGIRAGNEGGYRGFGWGVWMPGLFHTKIADMHGFFATHFGKPNTGTRNPGSLSFHNTLLHHLPISPTSLPNFRTCHDLVFVSLYARVLTCLLEVSGHGSLEEYLQKVRKWETLQSHAEEIINKFANPNIVDELREERESDDQKGGDMVFENAVLFLRDALLSREFTDAVKAGDSGRVLLVLKTWALSFRGNGRTKYAYEMLTLIHNLQNVWPKKIADIVLNNWLLNPTGNPNSFVEVDLVQEHMNFWIKTFYKAHGANASWGWHEMISPCVHSLRHLVTNMKKVLGTDIGSRHKPVDLTIDIRVLMDSLREHGVYSVVPGRKVDSDEPAVPDVVAEGYRNLTEGQALKEYNEMFLKSQRQRRVSPLVTDETADRSAPVTGLTMQDVNTANTSTTPTAVETLSGEFPGSGAPAMGAVEALALNDAHLGDMGDEDEDIEMGDDTGTSELESALDAPEETLGLDTFDDVEFDMDSREEEEEEEEEEDTED